MRRATRAPTFAACATLATVGACVLLLAAPAETQGRTTVTTLLLDVIGPRTTASVRAALGARRGELEACRREEDALVRVAFTIAPDGTIAMPTAVADPDLDSAATDCVVRLMPAWRFPGAQESATAVSWSFRLRGGTPQRRACWCFDWVHGADHGRACMTTRALCEAGIAHRGNSGDTTRCRSSREFACVSEGFVSGVHLRFE